MTTQASIPLKWYVPFATGDASRVEIPVTSSDATRASQTLGFPPLTMQPPAVGGVPPQGEDFNGAMNQVARVAWWVLNGGGWPYDATFATNASIGGYPNGAVLQSADFLGNWISTADNNQANPDTVGTNWVPGFQYGTTAVTGLTGGTITLTPLQAAKRGITLSGTLGSALVVIVPNWVKDWSFTNNLTGAFTTIVKTAAGSGVTIPQNGSPTPVSGDGTNVNQSPQNIAVGTSSTHAAQVSQTSGRLLNVQVFSANGTYNPFSSAVSSIIAEVQAGGASSGATVATSSSQNSIGATGGAGTYAKARFTTGFTGGIAVTVGAGGTATTGNGNPGGTSSLGSLISCPGGTGGAVGTLTTTPVLTPGSAAAALATITGAAQVLANIAGDGGTYGSCLTPASATVIAGHGGNSPLGNGGQAGSPAVGLGFGGGGGGVAQGPSGAARNGLPGAGGVVIVYEYA